METKRVKDDLEDVARLLRNGGLAAVPTETVYGLAGNGLDERAVREIYEVKGRPEQKPLSLMVPGPEAMARYCDPVPEAAKKLAARFWPGPLTSVLKAKELVPEIVRAGGETVGLRCPDHPLTLELLRLAKVPFAAPSANPSGAPSPKTAEEVLAYFDGKIPAVVDGGPCGLGRESTLIDMSHTPYRILRQGALAAETIADALTEEMCIVGVTGGTGCGKTTALAALKARGALVLDCDAVYHELLAQNRDLIAELDTQFPGTVENGSLDRKALGRVVFADPEALDRLNTLTHRYVGQEVRSRLRDWAMAGGTLAAVDAIELIGSGLAEICDFTVGVLADGETRARRIMARDGISREYALLRIEAQHPDSYFRDNCTVVLENNGDREAFLSQFNQILEERIKHG